MKTYYNKSYYRRNYWRARWYRKRENILLIAVFVNGYLAGGMTILLLVAGR